MPYQPTIQRFVAFTMLVLFVFSITPKRFLHHWFANHHDTTAQVANSHHQTQVHHEGIGCDCDNLVATSPFSHQPESINFALPIYYGQTITPFICNAYSADLVLSTLRGPPAQA